MPCPFFLPEELLDASGWAIAPRTPLGKARGGKCVADAKNPVRPDLDTLWNWCNFGYARGSCVRFPSSQPDDAVRFARINGKLSWIVEQEHSPARFGELNDETPELIRLQAAAFEA